MRLLIATKNAHKTEEIRAILGEAWTIEDLTAHPEIESPEETGATFAENAGIKALAASRKFDGYVLADDSGLEADALGGAPGVISARYAGVNATDQENRARLLRELKHFPTKARFRCVICIAVGETIVGTFDGTVEGSIISAERGAGGFGYDALFVPSGFDQTFGELPAATKNKLSHRAAALRAAQDFLIKIVDAPNDRPA
jgi:XTP/dITP diphosphohydrolase